MKIIDVKESIQSQFRASVQEGVAPLEVTFSNESADAQSFSWDFGDNQISTEESPTHVFQNPGIYVVRLQATNEMGCGTIFSRNIVVWDVLTPIEDPVVRNVSIYPNPTSGLASVSWEAENLSDLNVQVYDLLGNTVLEKFNLNGQIISLDMQHLTAGVYMIMIQSKDRNVKIIKRIVKY
ncbi:MAG: T9SS type A sorting domain-containing protein [Bacteroidia bacterium]|nr:T9SS type A sorting domain-containing protein [Bacteroidia bacterium]